MKITKARLKQIIMEELQNEGSGRGEGAMADRQLNRIADLATMIDEMVDDNTKLEPWVESKITMAHAYLSAVLNYLKGEEADAREDEMGGEGEEDMPMPDYEASPLEKFLMMQSRGKSLTDLDEVEDIEMLEEEMTDKQMKERDRQAEAMMDSMIDQYGKKEGKRIAYATATKNVLAEQ